MGWLNGNRVTIERILGVMRASQDELLTDNSPSVDLRGYVVIRGAPYLDYSVPMPNRLMLPHGPSEGLVVASTSSEQIYHGQNPLITFSLNSRYGGQHLLHPLDSQVATQLLREGTSIALLYEDVRPASSLIVNRLRRARELFSKESL